MKKLALMVILVLLFLLPMLAPAADYSFDKQVIKVEQEKDYLVVTIINKQVKEPIVYRIYPCGKVDKKEWKELAPNKEPETIWRSYPTIVPDILTITPYATELYNGTGSLTIR